MKPVYVIPFNRYFPVSFEGVYVYEQFDRLKSFLKLYFDSSVQNLLLHPVKEKEVVRFYCDTEYALHELEHFDSGTQNDLIARYNAIKYDISKRLVALSVQDPSMGENWIGLFETVLNDQNNLILSDGTNIFLVWGWKISHHQNYILPFEQFQKYIITPQKQELPDLEEPQTAHIPEPILVDLESESPITVPPAETIPEEDIDGTQNKPHEIMVAQAPTNSPPKKTSPLIDQKNYLGRWGWLLLALLLLLLLLLGYYFLERGWSRGDVKNWTSVEINERFYETMPDQARQRILPIDTSKVIEDGESRAKIIGNLLNVAMKDTGGDFKKFSLAILEKLEPEGCKVVYYDDLTRRLQLEVPERLRENLKNSIKTDLPEYPMLVWDESVFESTKTMSDPDFRKPDLAWYLRDIGASFAWDKTTGSESVVVAIIDDGFDLTHPELNQRVYKPYNVNTHNTEVVAYPERIHGTHVASLAIGCANNDWGLCGVAPGCSFMPIQAAGIDGFFTSTDVIDGLLYAIQNGADVVNLSLGRAFSAALGRLTEEDQEKLSKNFGLDEANFWDELFAMAEANGVFVVLAAGNDGVLTDLDPMHRSKRALKVGAVDNHFKIAEFSNFKPFEANGDDMIYAPGVGIYSATPEKSFALLDGTSMAAPLVTGSIALIKSANPSISNDEIINILKGDKPTKSKPFIPKILNLKKYF